MILFVLQGCGGSPGPGGEEVVLRVSATAGLEDFVPGAHMGGSSAAALDLVYELANPHIHSMTRRGRNVILVRNETSPFSAEQLAGSLRFRGLRSARALDKELIEAEFDSESTAELYAAHNFGGFDLGPYQVVESDATSALLRSRAVSSIDGIEVIELSKREEWRHLVTRQLDVIPSATALHKRQFENMDSVRLLDIAPLHAAALYFNVRDPELSDVRVRRWISALLDRAAISTVVCGDLSCTIPSEPESAEQIDSRPRRLSLVVIESESMMVLAAQLIAIQLEPENIEVVVDPVPIEEVIARGASGDFQLVIAPLPLSCQRYRYFLSASHVGNIHDTGYANPDYDAAYEAGDHATTQAIVERDVPATPLYVQQYFAAVDARFCGDVEPQLRSWRWMADLRPCEPGEVP